MSRLLITLVLAFAASSLPASENADKESKSARKAIQGTWKVVKAETGAGPVKRLQGATYTFAHDRLATTTARGGQMQATFELDARKTPAQMTYVVKNEAGENVVNHVIYQIKGDRLTLAGAWNSRAGVSAPFPKEFKVNPGDEMSYVIVLERVKASK